MSDDYARALADSGLDDVQPRYRRLLVRLKGQDPSGYETAVERYRSDVEASEAPEPLVAWLAYGGWLAQQIEPGRLMAISENGRARPVRDAAPAGPLLVHLPDASNRRGFVVAMPSTPSPAQSEAVSLLCE